MFFHASKVYVIIICKLKLIRQACYRIHRWYINGTFSRHVVEPLKFRIEFFVDLLEVSLTESKAVVIFNNHFHSAIMIGHHSLKLFTKLDSPSTNSSHFQKLTLSLSATKILSSALIRRRWSWYLNINLWISVKILWIRRRFYELYMCWASCGIINSSEAKSASRMIPRYLENSIWNRCTKRYVNSIFLLN